MDPTFPIGDSTAWKQVVEQCRLAASAGCNVLLTGPTGSGKGVLARLLWSLAGDKTQPFVHLNLAAVTQGLVEARLRGSVRGAFTGAVADTKGVFEQAQGGTLFLDEVGEASSESQVALLDILDSGLITPVGGSSPRRVDARVIAATNVDVGPRHSEGPLRPDLYYRLAQVHIRVPRLIERGADTLVLAKHFAGDIRLATDAVVALGVYDWPGNVRQLEHAIRWASVLAGRGPIRAWHLPDEVRPAGASRWADLAIAIARRLGRLRREDLKAWGVAPATASRALGEALAEGSLVRAGRGPGTFYRPSPWAAADCDLPCPDESDAPSANLHRENRNGW